MLGQSDSNSPVPILQWKYGEFEWLEVIREAASRKVAN